MDLDLVVDVDMDRDVGMDVDVGGRVGVSVGVGVGEEGKKVPNYNDFVIICLGGVCVDI